MTQQCDGLTTDDIKRLQAPLPLEDHEAREKGTNKDKTKKQYLVYINQEGVIPLLNAIDPNWSWDVQNVHFEAHYVSVTGRLTIKGVARDGVGGNSPNGASAPVDEDTVKGAETDALKRAALRFGVGLYLRSAPTFWIDANLASWKGAEQAMAEFGTWYKREFGAQKPAPAQQPPPPAGAPPAPAGVAQNAPKADGSTSTPPTSPTNGTAGASGDKLAQTFPAAAKWTPAMLYDATHDYFNAPEHFSHHWDKHEAEYAGKTLEEAAAYVWDLHWNFDKAQSQKLLDYAYATFRMSGEDALKALSDANGHSVRKWRDWDGGNFAAALAALGAWAKRQAELDLAKEGVS